MSPFEMFTEKKSYSSLPNVTILSSGGLFINSSCYEQFLKKYKYVNLLYDVKNQLIGIMPIDKPEPYSYKLTVSKAKTGCTISGLSFTNKYKIEHSKTRTLKAKWNSQEGLIEVDLKSSPAA